MPFELPKTGYGFERESAALALGLLAPDAWQPVENPMHASRLRRTPLTPSSEDTTYSVSSVQVTAQGNK